MPKGNNREAIAATAPNQIVAEMWVELLRNEGVPARVRATHVTSYYLGVSMAPCAVLVPAERLEEARGLLPLPESTTSEAANES